MPQKDWLLLGALGFLAIVFMSYLFSIKDPFADANGADNLATYTPTNIAIISTNTVTPIDTPIATILTKIPSPTVPTHTPIPIDTPTKVVTNNLILPVVPTNTHTPLATPIPPTETLIPTPTSTIMPIFSALQIEDCDGKKQDKDCTSEQDTTTINGNDWLIRWKPWNPPTDISSDWFYLISFFSGSSNEPFSPKRVTLPVERDGWLTYSIDQEVDLPADIRGCWPYWDIIVATNQQKELCPTRYTINDVCLITRPPNNKRALGTSHTSSCPAGGGGGGSQPGRPVIEP